LTDSGKSLRSVSSDFVGIKRCTCGRPSWYFLTGCKELKNARPERFTDIGIDLIALTFPSRKSESTPNETHSEYFKPKPITGTTTTKATRGQKRGRSFESQAFRFFTDLSNDEAN